MGLLAAINGFGNKLNSGELDLAMGLLSAAGPSVQPRGFGQVLAEATQFASDRDRARARNEFVRMQMESAKRKQKAMQKLPQVMGAPTAESSGFGTGSCSAPFMTAPQQQNKMMGLLAEAAPEQMTAGLLGQMFPKETRTPADLQTMAALDIPQTPEGFAQFNTIKNSGSLDAQIDALTLDKLQDEKSERDKVRETAIRSTQVGFKKTLNKTESMLDNLDILERTMMAPGGAAIDWRKGAGAVKAELEGALGLNPAETKKVLAAYDSLVKDMNGYGVDMISGLELTTNKSFDALRSSLPSPELQTQANRAVMGSLLKDAMDEFYIAQIDLPESERKRAEKILERIQKTQGMFDATGYGSGVDPATIDGFDQLNPADQAILAEKLNSLPPGELQEILRELSEGSL